MIKTPFRGWWPTTANLTCLEARLKGRLTRRSPAATSGVLLRWEAVFEVFSFLFILLGLGEEPVEVSPRSQRSGTALYWRVSRNVKAKKPHVIFHGWQQLQSLRAQRQIRFFLLCATVTSRAHLSAADFSPENSPLMWLYLFRDCAPKKMTTLGKLAVGGFQKVQKYRKPEGEKKPHKISAVLQ